MHGCSMDRNFSSVGASVGKPVAAHEFCLWLTDVKIMREQVLGFGIIIVMINIRRAVQCSFDFINVRCILCGE